MIIKFMHFICYQCNLAFKEREGADTINVGVCPRCGIRNKEYVGTSEKEFTDATPEAPEAA